MTFIAAFALLVLCSYPVIEGSLYPEATTEIRLANDWRLLVHRSSGAIVVQLGPLIIYSRPRVPGSFELME